MKPVLVWLVVSAACCGRVALALTGPSKSDDSVVPIFRGYVFNVSSRIPDIGNLKPRIKSYDHPFITKIQMNSDSVQVKGLALNERGQILHLNFTMPDKSFKSVRIYLAPRKNNPSVKGFRLIPVAEINISGHPAQLRTRESLVKLIEKLASALNYPVQWLKVVSADVDKERTVGGFAQALESGLQINMMYPDIRRALNSTIAEIPNKMSSVSNAVLLKNPESVKELLPTGYGITGIRPTDAFYDLLEAEESRRAGGPRRDWSINSLDGVTDSELSLKSGRTTSTTTTTTTTPEPTITPSTTTTTTTPEPTTTSSTTTTTPKPSTTSSTTTTTPEPTTTSSTTTTTPKPSTTSSTTTTTPEPTTTSLTTTTTAKPSTTSSTTTTTPKPSTTSSTTTTTFKPSTTSSTTTTTTNPPTTGDEVRKAMSEPDDEDARLDRNRGEGTAAVSNHETSSHDVLISIVMPSVIIIVMVLLSISLICAIRTRIRTTEDFDLCAGGVEASRLNDVLVLNPTTNAQTPRHPLY